MVLRLLLVSVMSGPTQDMSAEWALGTGASALLLLSSLPRVAKGPVPAVLTATSTASALYYGRIVYILRQQ